MDERNRGWWRVVDLDTLDLSHEMDCILGQTYGEFHDAVYALGIRGLDHFFGFDIHPGTEDEDDASDYQLLNNLWYKVIYDRIQEERY